VHVQLDPAAARGKSAEDLAPELKVALWYSALAMHSERDARDGRASFQHAADRVAAVRRVIDWREALNHVVGVRTCDPLVGLRPDAQLEMQPVRGGFIAGDAESLEIACAFGRRQAGHTNIVAGHVDQKGVRKQQVRVNHVAQKVMAHTKREMDAVEAVAGQHRQIAPPELRVAEPGQVLDVAGKQARHAPDRIGRRLDSRTVQAQRRQRVVHRGGDAISQFKRRVCQPARIGARGEHPVRAERHQGQRLGSVRNWSARQSLEGRAGDGRVETRQHHADSIEGCLFEAGNPGHPEPVVGQSFAQLGLSPGNRARTGHRIDLVTDNGDGSRLAQWGLLDSLR